MFVEHLDIFHSQAIHLYTDGSKSGVEAGCAAVSQMHAISRKLSDHVSIFMAELIAIVDALNIIHNGHHRKCCHFFVIQKVYYKQLTIVTIITQ